MNHFFHTFQVFQKYNFKFNFQEINENVNRFPEERSRKWIPSKWQIQKEPTTWISSATPFSISPQLFERERRSRNRRPPCVEAGFNFDWVYNRVRRMKTLWQVRNVPFGKWDFYSERRHFSLAVCTGDHGNLTVGIKQEFQYRFCWSTSSPGWIWCRYYHGQFV